MAEFKRKRYFIKKGFQLRYVGVIILLVLSAIILSGIITYYSIFPFLSEKLANVYPQGRLMVVLSQANSRLIYAAVILIPVGVWMGIMLSHRIAGPWYRLERILYDMAKGKLAEEIVLRKTDELKSLADALNEVIRRHKTTGGKQLSAVTEIENIANELKAELEKEDADILRSKLLVAQLQNLLKEAKQNFIFT